MFEIYKGFWYKIIKKNVIYIARDHDIYHFSYILISDF